MPDTQATDAELADLQALASDVSTTTRANVTRVAAATSAWQADPASTPGIPNLPPGTTLDLTHPTVKLPNVPEFTIPGILSVPSSESAVIAPGSLSTGDWIIIARNNDLLRAYTLDNPGDPPDPERPPARAQSMPLDYMVPTSADFFVDEHLTGTVKHTVTYSAETASYVRGGFDKQSASLSIPYAAASFERQNKEKQAQASSRKRIFMFGSWFYPRATLYTKKFTKASTRFTDAIKAAVDANDATELEKVFNTYGRAVPEEVTIGAQLFLTYQEECDASVNETEAENTIAAAVNAKYNGVAASAGISFGNASNTRVTAEQLSRSTAFESRGGDATLASNPQRWPDTIKDPNKWAVIGVSKLAPITDWLEPALKARMERLLPALQPPLVVPAENHSARADSDGFIFGVRTGQIFNTGWLPKDVRGRLEFVCGPSGSPALGQTDAVGASTTFHSSHPHDTWIDGASICLPVPKGSHYSVSKRDDFLNPGGAYSRFQRAETKLTFGQWRTLGGRTDFTGAGSNEYHAPGEVETDGFIFCSVRAPGPGDRGFVSCTVDGKILGAASVHDHPPESGCWSPYACFCVPVPRLLQMSIEATASYGKLDIKIWYLASTSRDWKFGRPEQYTLNALHTAETDGFLNGVVTVRQGNARGMLFLYCGRDQDNIARQNVIPAMMAVHQTTGGNRYIPYASAMLPIRRGFVFRPVPQDLSQDPGHSPATVEAYWTPLVVA